jgi:hypothetical protein
MNSLLGYKDVFIAPIYFALILFISILINNRINRRTPHLKKYFMWGIYVRIFGAIAFGIVYSFFYGGDTFAYFINGSRFIWEAFLENPKVALSIIFSNSENLNLENLYYTNRMELWYGSSSLIKFSGFLGLFTFHTYTINALLFSLFCFSGLWVTYKTLLSYYPHLYKKLSIAILFFPSLVFWGSGVMKDPLSLGALGWAFYAWDFAFIKREKVFKSIIILLLSFWLISIYKSYILLSFIPPAALYIFLVSNGKMKNKATRALAKPVFMFVAIVISYFGIIQLTKGSEYDLENLAYKSSITYGWIKNSSGINSSAYDLGEMDGTVSGMMQAMPKAINVCLFRPYIWEVKNIFMLLSSFESAFLFFLTISVVLKAGIKNVLLLINNDPLINFLIIFSLAFAFGTGVSTGNFGTLVRYKIPLLPFYLSAIYIIGDRLIKVRSKKSKVTNINSHPALSNPNS